ncbi:odorant receptor 9a-like [Anopheles cruzii]|uniref:odorant receptor 9a-like n=1 Tax=Anopheles cruzii TaxID=68878 RepID=UPI0022EC65C3|nr:odorant receptor 9a-like [Anopheles cruzii]
MEHTDGFLTLPYLRYCGIYREMSKLKKLRTINCSAVLFVFMILQSIYVLQNVEDFLSICDVIPTLVVGLVAICKLCIFVLKPAAIFSLIDSFKMLQKHSNGEKQKLFQRSSRFHANLTKVYIMGALIVGWFYILSAVVAGVRQSIVEEKLRFFAPMAFPHNYQHPVVFVATLLFNCDSIHMSIFINGSVDTCFSELATNVAIHFNIIQDRARSIDFSKHTQNDLQDVIHYHMDLLSICSNVNSIFQHTVFYLLMLDSVLLCVIGYQFVLFMKTPRVVMLLSMAFVMLLQAVIYTYHGSKMHDESLRVADAFYQSNWYEGSLSMKRKLLFCMMRAQKPVVTKGGFIKATLPTLKKMLNSTGSYITMLLSLDTNVAAEQ